MTYKKIRVTHDEEVALVGLMSGKTGPALQALKDKLDKAKTFRGPRKRAYCPACTAAAVQHARENRIPGSQSRYHSEGIPCPRIEDGTSGSVEPVV